MSWLRRKWCDWFHSGFEYRPNLGAFVCPLCERVLWRRDEEEREQRKMLAPKPFDQ